MTIAALESLSFGLARMAAAAADAGHGLTLLTGDRTVYRHELATLPDTLPDGALTVVDVDTFDTAATRRALAALPRLTGLVNTTDTWSVPAADLAAEFGLPGPDPAAVRVLRDKARIRALLHGAGLSKGPAVPVPSGADPSDADTAAAEVLRTIGLPAVLKDSAGTSSRDVWVVRDEEALRAALAEAGRRSLTGALFAEPFLAGPLYSAETLSWDGDTRLLGVLSRQTSREPAVREEAAAFPVALPPGESAGIEEWAGRVLHTAGHHSGFAHVEFILTAEGPELVEINRRIGGALVGEALCRSLRTNVYDAMIDAALGRRPRLMDAPLAHTGPACGFVLVYPDRAGELAGWRGLDGLGAYPGAVRWYPVRAPGDTIATVTDQRGCTGMVMAEAATAELALHRAASAAAGVRPVLVDDGGR
ncbi:ATP-grasp domain-containing protein [Streptomyces lushanensis]|uniref:ATP-grasp domain-containing protein n=1 Tax=Streptomyces lushanensis TaxID=1434255 RepID=UPI00082B1075|nr:ATP-grasp domain-containing protein [Streptomyces lushanensis]